MGAAALEVRGIVVRYGATTALNGIDLDIQPGEVHAVVGENGAGKSTLLRAVAGVVRANAGDVHVRAGVSVAWVPQETVLPPDLTVTEWIFLGCELRGRMRQLQHRAMTAAAVDVLRSISCRAAARARLGSLPLAQRKQVQLARALRGAPGLLLLDEPTAVLGEAETQHLFTRVRALKHAGAGVLYVSHRLDEVLAIADRVTVLRDGQRVSTDPVAAVDTTTLVQRMVGRELPAHQRAARELGNAVLRLNDVATAHVRGLSLSVRRGEIVGLAGLVGAGRSEVLEAIVGLRRLRAGRIERTGALAFVPEDRGSKGLIAALRLRENIFLPADGWRLRANQEGAAARSWIQRLGIRASGTEAAIDSLSGGNQQKVLLARALRHGPELLLLDEPTAGVDVGAKAEIHDVIRQLAHAGTAILLASSELPELLVLCDRIVALREGQEVGEVPIDAASEPRLAAMITGAEA
jgi:ABC-type sugar transport system ATPase subunit